MGKVTGGFFITIFFRINGYATRQEEATCCIKENGTCINLGYPSFSFLIIPITWEPHCENFTFIPS